MSTTLVRSDEKLRDVVVEEFDWDPKFDASQIGVVADDGTVSLTGFVDTYTAKLDAERAAKRVRGVRAVANDLQVKTRFQRPDPEIAKEALQALRSRLSVPEAVQVAVRNGYLTLDGTVDWMFQKSAAESAVKHVRGVIGVGNNIAIAPKLSPADVKARIEKAFLRNATVDAGRITVTATGGVVSLGGTVHSWTEKTEAELAAWAAPGVAKVESHLRVMP